MLTNQRGIASIEIVPVIAVFVLLINFALGFFGFIHSGILSSIAARNYAFETFRNRADLKYLRDTVDSGEVNYGSTGMRYHGVITEGSNRQAWIVTQRPIKFTEITEMALKGSATDHDRLKAIREGDRVSNVMSEDGVSPGWVRTLYGICLNAQCGGS